MDKKFRIEKIVLPFSTSLPNIFRNLKFVRKQRADVYHITGDVHYAVLAFPRRRTMLTIHDCVFLRRPEGIRRSLLKWLLLDLPVSRSALITTISDATKMDILKNTRCSPNKIVVIPNPVNDGIYYRPAVFNASCPVILFLGSTPNKNLSRVIPALEGIDCLLTIVGEIPDDQRAMLEKYGISYTQKTRLSDPELADQYAGADLVLFPSVFEGFGLPVVEAQKAGRVVITSDLSPMKEVAGGAACLVDPFSVASIREGIIAVIRDERYRGELVEKGFRNAAGFAAGAIAQQYEDCYQKILSE